jgi:c-di-GMP-binding flagellar brake protein YcgR
MHFRLRTFQRALGAARITVQARDFCLSSTSSNISLGGLFLLSEGQVPVGIGDVYKLTVNLPEENEDAGFVVNGMAIRIQENGIAFRFIETDSDVLRRLFSFIYPASLLAH